MKRILAVVFLLATLIPMAGCTKSDAVETEVEIDTVRVKVSTVVPGTYIRRGVYYGTATGVREATMVSPLGGLVSAVSVKEGAYVKSGASLASIDSERVSTLFETAKLNEKIAREQHERTVAHFEAGNASQVEVDRVKLGWLSARQNLLDAKKAYMGGLAIAPFAGSVVLKYIDRNQELAPGSPTFSIAQLHKMKIRFGVPESEVAEISVGNEAIVTFDNYHGREWSAKVKSVAKKSSSVSMKFPVEIHIDNKDRRIFSGMTARIRLDLSTRNDAIVVPTEAVLTEGAQNSVMTVENGLAARKIVRIGPQDRGVTLLEEGVVAGDNIVVAGQHLLSDGSLVKVVE